MVYVETPTNPMMEITDLAAAAEIAHRRGIPLAVDNTFMSPYFQRPLELGADVVVHSTTKFLNGHSDSIGGVVVTAREQDAEWFAFVQKSAGAILSPFDSFLVLRGIKTLASAWSATRRTAAPSPRTSTATPRCGGSSIPASPTTPATLCSSVRPPASAP